MCDIIIAADTARFGQPEINLGVIPGAGGTQRLTRAIGKSKAMDMVLTGRMMDAAEAERCNLVSRVVPADRAHREALKIAAKIAALSPVAAAHGQTGGEPRLRDDAGGRRARRAALCSCRCSARRDQREGMAAFAREAEADFRAGLNDRPPARPGSLTSPRPVNRTALPARRRPCPQAHHHVTMRTDPWPIPLPRASASVRPKAHRAQSGAQVPHADICQEGGGGDRRRATRRPRAEALRSAQPEMQRAADKGRHPQEHSGPQAVASVRAHQGAGALVADCARCGALTSALP